MRIFSNDVDNALEHMLFLRLLLFPLLLAFYNVCKGHCCRSRKSKYIEFMIHRGTPTLSSILQYIRIAHCYSTEGQRVLNKVRAVMIGQSSSVDHHFIISGTCQKLGSISQKNQQQLLFMHFSHRN